MDPKVGRETAGSWWEVLVQEMGQSGVCSLSYGHPRWPCAWGGSVAVGRLS